MAKLWLLKRLEDGKFERLPWSSYDAFIDGYGVMKPDNDGYVRVLQLLVDWGLGRIHNAWFVKHRVDSVGKIDAEHWQRSLGMAVSKLDFGVSKPQSIDNVIDASKKFMEKIEENQHMWRPTDEELQLVKHWFTSEAAIKKTLERGQVWGTLKRDQRRTIVKFEEYLGHPSVIYADHHDSMGVCSLQHFMRWVRGGRGVYGPKFLLDVVTRIGSVPLMEL